MHPLLFERIPTYFVLWLAAAGLCIASAAFVGQRNRLPRFPTVLAVAFLSAAVLAG